ncbi:hypothetical protein SARC_03371 [Sphaeroforma arctica JP610]|uniref:Uncharacterized protein n=1 Tax=Sphaeroforma arctica JP610 TaxID=667725 RepID=A0A0L0G634_9EUKA|nr:hypothetical protein SARC_03371 [Sphaeroforma arctica JP610]KNC84409.1 hypothetical protein SARC_03371 [Sphaeroforma arctica JP610]|eukprot:XP_014158311.1 hypothetical protein SARC_03371 [Sphaeroforma arctica JP610]
MDGPMEDVIRERLRSIRRSVFGVEMVGTFIEPIVCYTHELSVHASAKRLDQPMRTLCGWCVMMEMCTHVCQSCDDCQAISDDLGLDKRLQQQPRYSEEAMCELSMDFMGFDLVSG